MRQIILNTHLALLIVLVSLFLIKPKLVFADDTQCIAVYPCLEDGSIDPQYDVVGECGDRFRAQCKIVQSNISDSQLQSCQDENAHHEKVEAELKGQIKKLRKQLRFVKSNTRR